MKTMKQHQDECEIKSRNTWHNFVKRDITPITNWLDKRIDKIDEKLERNDDLTKNSEFGIKALTTATNLMNNNINKLEWIIKDWFENIDKKFVTKEEIKPFKWAIWILLAWLIWAFVQRFSELIFK